MTTDEHRCELCGDRIELAPGRTLELRHIHPGDGPGLADLYARLGPEDIYRRFFTSVAPAKPWFDDWAGIEARGGFGLVAVREDEHGRRIVAEAGYAKLCDGDGELGIAVDPDSRGWLGPWLLDALLRHAAARGIPNMQALVLSENRRMATMAVSRGVATMNSDDWTMTRVSMSTSGPMPSWPANAEDDEQPKRTRLLVESDRSRWSGTPLALAAGFDVMVCRGPDAQPHGCPVLRGERCPLLDGADLVVRVLDPASPASVSLLLDASVVHPGNRLIDGFVIDQSTGATVRRPDADVVADAVEASTTLQDPPPRIVDPP